MIDFLVIGGGIAGLSAGARLAPHGEVVLLEKEDGLGYHASGRSAALYEAQYGKASTIALNLASRAFHQEGGYLSPRGLMVVGKAGDEAGFRQEVADAGLNVISVDEAIAMVPILNPETVAYAAWHEDAMDLDTDRMLQDFARDIRSHGGQVLPKTTVEVITRTPDGWEVTANGTTYAARRLVNAAGPWADTVAEMAGVPKIGIVPHRRSMARIPAPGGHDMTGWPMIFSVGETWYCKPDAGKLLVSPAEEDAMEPHDAWADDMVLAEGLARYEEMMTEPVTRLETSWAGLRSFAPDRQLVLGPDPVDPAFVWSAGQGGYGFQTAPAASQLVADLTLGKPPALADDIVAALRPDRLR